MSRHAQPDDEYLEHVRELVDLWALDRISPNDLAPHVQGVLTLWVAVFEQVKPFQQQSVRVEGIVDHDYQAMACQAERLLALMGYFGSRKIGLSLREALELTDPSLKMWALVSLLRRYEPVPKDDLEAVASSHIVRITFWECLQELEMESLMPARWSAPQEFAASALSRWLSRPNELNAIPEEIELMRTFPAVDHAGDPMEVYLFRFREYPKPWEPGEGWMAGVAGPYRDGEQIESPWSSFRRWDSMSPEDHFEMLWGGDACGRPGLHNQ
jgi:hypothetical protein